MLLKGILDCQRLLLLLRSSESGRQISEEYVRQFKSKDELVVLADLVVWQVAGFTFQVQHLS